ncbi:MAG TPA: MaoC family dehydratase N-terminal domain-containing protein [Amycolatopsis sp.]|nr:MaoC family dehydratase N-terminal domain-containing protein [Amycolatopsis sp.]
MTENLEEDYLRLQALLGRERTETLGVVSGRDLMRFAVAARCPPGQVPLFLSSLMGWDAGPAEDRLGTDGAGATETRGLPLGEVRLMGAGQELEFHAPVTAETTIVVHTRLAEVRLKHGRSGPLLIMRILRRFTDETDRPLLTCQESFIAR